MKQIIKISFITLIIIFNNCKKLDINPSSNYTNENYFETVEHATSAIYGVYDALSTQTIYGRNVSLVYPLDTDVSQVGTSFINSKKPLESIGHYSIDPNNDEIKKTWQALYRGIYRANNVIENVMEMNLYINGTELDEDNNTIFTQERKELNRILGEAYFLRGLMYFELVKLWGDVPLTTRTTNHNDNLFVERTSKNIVYNQIIYDMTKAKNLIPSVTEAEINERVKKGAVRGILMRVYLHRAGYSLDSEKGIIERPSNYLDYYFLAMKEGDTLINIEKNYDLHTSYKQLFYNYTSFIIDPTESMLEIAFYSSVGTSGGCIAAWNGTKIDKESKYGRGEGLVWTTSLYHDSFHPDDTIRKNINIVTYNINAKDEFKDIDNTYQYRCGKWRREWISKPPLNQSQTDVNWVLLRYADVLLMYAEIINELNNGPTQGAYDAINKVRNRVNLSDISSGLSYTDFKTAIINERAWELGLEGLRKYDLIRWNMLTKKITDTHTYHQYQGNYPYLGFTYFVTNKHELYPIPQREIEQNQKLTQNPNY